MFLLGFYFWGVWEVNKRSGGSKQRDPYPAKEEEFGPPKMSKIEKRGRTEEGGGITNESPSSCSPILHAVVGRGRRTKASRKKFVPKRV